MLIPSNIRPGKHSVSTNVLRVDLITGRDKYLGVMQV